MALSWIDITGLIIIILTLVAIILNVKVLTATYKKTKNISTLYFDFVFIFFIIAIITLLLEKVGFTIYDNNPNQLIAYFSEWNAIIALIFSGCSIITINLFAFHNTYPEKKKIIMPIIIILAALYVFLLCYSIFSNMYMGGLWAQVLEGEITYTAEVSLWSFIFLIPMVLPGPIVFFYFSYMTKESNPGNSKRSLWMGIAITFFFIGYN
ncbi:MAG: hypothetical protein EAX96_15455 [Candidatus Lokiarchaeota archaeon]|nr:hypothetical protein [Candidatus Lokiarchaeota archaeon]